MSLKRPFVDLHSGLKHYRRYHDTQEHITVKGNLDVRYVLHDNVSHDSHEDTPSRFWQPTNVEETNNALDHSTDSDDKDNDQ